MELVNGLTNYKEKVQDTNLLVVKEAIENLILLLAPFAPHITEELWHILGKEESVHLQKWPEYDPQAIVVDEVTIVVQVNGKVRDKITVPNNLDKDSVLRVAKNQPKIIEYINGKEVKRNCHTKQTGEYCCCLTFWFNESKHIMKATHNKNKI